MYVAVVSLILGQALLLGNVNILAYAAFVWFATASVCHRVRGTNTTEILWCGV